MDSQKWKMNSVGRKIRQIILAAIIVVVLGFAIKEVRDVLATWAIMYPTIKEIALYALSSIIIIIIALIGFILYHFSE